MYEFRVVTSFSFVKFCLNPNINIRINYTFCEYCQKIKVIRFCNINQDLEESIMNALGKKQAPHLLGRTFLTGIIVIYLVF